MIGDKTKELIDRLVNETCDGRLQWQWTNPVSNRSPSDTGSRPTAGTMRDRQVAFVADHHGYRCVLWENDCLDLWKNGQGVLTICEKDVESLWTAVTEQSKIRRAEAVDRVAAEILREI